MTGKEVCIPEFPELVFEEMPHIYLLNGEKIPSVSNIMEPLSGAHYSGVSEKTLDHAAERGTNVHNAIEIYLKFGIVDIPEESRGYLDAFLKWHKDAKPELVGSEIRMYHKLLRYAGTCDLLCCIGEKLVLVDFKTTYTVSEMTCGVQLEAYSQALSSHGVKVDEKRILQLKKDGKYKEYSFPVNDAQRWRVFGACKTVYDYTKAA